jgi:tripartite-type tricarboxylate transporter receptor subunit TctC
MGWIIRLPAIVGLLLQVFAAHAQGWPAKPVRMYVGSPPGSAPDIIARVVADKLTQSLGQQVIIENRGGAGGNMAAQAAARSPNDGHSLWFAHATPVVLNQYLFKSPGFDVDRDFAAIVRIGISPMMIAVNHSVPAGNLAELIAHAKAQPGKVSFATSQSKNIPHLTGEALNHSFGIDLLHVPYKASPQAAQDTIAGLTQIYIDGIPPMIAHVQSGRLRAIVVTAPNRLAGFEQIPTLAESAPGLAMTGWFAIFAPAGTPAGVIARVNRDTNTAVALPDVAARLHSFGVYEHGGTPKALEDFIVSERRLWEKTVRLAKIEPE